jgi:hypothetical protein
LRPPIPMRGWQRQQSCGCICDVAVVYDCICDVDGCILFKTVSVFCSNQYHPLSTTFLVAFRIIHSLHYEAYESKSDNMGCIYSANPVGIPHWLYFLDNAVLQETLHTNSFGSVENERHHEQAREKKVALSLSKIKWRRIPMWRTKRERERVSFLHYY